MLTDLERTILAGARDALKNPILRMKDILKLSSRREDVIDNLRPGEVAVFLSGRLPGMCVSVEEQHDKRDAEGGDS